LKEKAVTKNPSTELHDRRPLNRAPTPPGEFFREILEEHLRLSISEAVSRMGISRQSLHAVLRGEAAVTADFVATVGALPFRSDRPFGVNPLPSSGESIANLFEPEEFSGCAAAVPCVRRRNQSAVDHCIACRESCSWF
jgi:hypothetical protein